jgi:hypothetical protein
MNATDTQETPKTRRQYLTSWYCNKYQTDMDFRNKEIARLTEARKKSYHSNPEVRAKMIQNAKDRYYRMKEAAARDKQE